MNYSIKKIMRACIVSVLFFGTAHPCYFRSIVSPDDKERLEIASSNCYTYFFAAYAMRLNLVGKRDNTFFEREFGTDKDTPILRSRASTQYKIHLMPTPSRMAEVVNRLIYFLLECPSFCLRVNSIKIHDYAQHGPQLCMAEESEFFFDKYAQALLPVIVVYAGTGHAQALVHIFDHFFANIPGLHGRDLPPALCERLKISADDAVIPRYNVAAKTRDASRTSSIIYYAQANADCKNELKIKDTLDMWFDASENHALYRPDFLQEPKDFHLYLADKDTQISKLIGIRGLK